MPTRATTVAEFLNGLPADRRVVVEAVRKVVRANLDPKFEEGLSYGMLGWYVPHRVYPAGYHCDPKLPLPFASLASQKNHLSLHMLSIYMGGTEESWLREQFRKAGKKLDMGKGCIRFEGLDDLPLDVIGEAIRRVTVKAYIENYEKQLGARQGGAAAKKTAAKKTGAAKKPKPAAAQPSRRKTAK